MDAPDLDDMRDFYARLVTSQAPGVTPELVAAFRRVPREHYLPKGPWRIPALNGSFCTPSDSVHFLYTDTIVILEEDKRLNNASPSLHARALAATGVQRGEAVLQVGVGLGYYTAILAELTGPSGRVLGYEIEPVLAEAAFINLKGYPNVTVAYGDGVRAFTDSFDVIYVCAGVSGVPEAWVSCLRIGGRMMLPLTPVLGLGLMLVIERVRSDVCRVTPFWSSGFYPCVGAGDPEAQRRLKEALLDPRAWTVKSLRRDFAPDETAWFVQSPWWFSTGPPEARGPCGVGELPARFSHDTQVRK